MRSFRIFIIVILISSCSFENIVQIELPEHIQKSVVIANIEKIDTIQSILVSNSASTSKGGEVLIQKNSIVTVSRNQDNDEVIFDFNDQSNYYEKRIDSSFWVEEEYKLTVESADFDIVESKQIFPSSIENLNIVFTENGGPLDEFGGELDAIRINFKDGVKEDYYIVSIRVDRKTGGSSFVLSENVEPTLNPVSLKEFAGYLFSDVSFNGEAKSISIFDNFKRSGTEKIHVSVRHISKDGFLYYQSLAKFMENDQNIFVEPINVHSNIDGGFGIFSLSNTLIIEFKF